MTIALKLQTIHGLWWSSLESFGLRGIQLAAGITLARILAPELFGLIGMVAVFLAIAQAFIDGGFGTALIQKPDAVELDICSVFYFNIFIGFFSAAAFWLMAPLISAFYGQPELTPLARVLSPLIFINSFGLIQETTLSKHISFKTITQASLIGSVISGTGAVILAWTGFGIWSLIFQLLSNSVIKVLLLWILSSWRPTNIFSVTSLRKMFAYASKMFVSSLLGHIFGNCYSLIIGRLFSANDLAFFTRAKTVGELPTETISGIVGRVIFPIFSKIQNDRVKLKIVMRKSLVFMVMLNFPVMTLLAVIAKPLVLLLLTDKWADSIPYLQLFCFVGLIYPLHLINLNVVQAMGRSDLFLRLEIIKKIFVIINVSITWQWGISALICGMILTSFISYYLNSYYIGQLIDYPIKEQLIDLTPYLILTTIMAVVTYVTGLIPYPNLWSQIISQITVAMLSYIGSCGLFRPTGFMDTLQTGRDLLASFHATK